MDGSRIKSGSHSDLAGLLHGMDRSGTKVEVPGCADGHGIPPSNLTSQTISNLTSKPNCSLASNLHPHPVLTFSPPPTPRKNLREADLAPQSESPVDGITPRPSTPVDCRPSTVALEHRKAPHSVAHGPQRYPNPGGTSGTRGTYGTNGANANPAGLSSSSTTANRATPISASTAAHTAGCVGCVRM